MTNQEINESVNILCDLFGKELESDLKKFVQSVFNDDKLIVGVRDGDDLLVREIIFTSYMVFDEDEGTVLSAKYEPDEFSHNDFNLYFGAEEIIVNNDRDNFLAIIGSKWFKNDIYDEFVEAIIFGKHDDIPSIDCMYGSIKVNKPFGISNYLSPGSIVSLKPYSFKNTTYLELHSFMQKSIINDEKNNAWYFGNILKQYNWHDRYYLEEEESEY